MLSRYLPVFIILSIIAEILGTVGGFGSSVFFVPVANYFLDFQSVLGITALFHLSSNVTKIAFFKKGIDKKLVLYLGIPAVIFVFIGGILSRYFEGFWLTIALGIFLVLLSLIFLIYKKLVLAESKRNAIVGGALSGFFAGILGTGGAIRGITMSAFKMDKAKFIATSAVIDLGIDFTRSFVYYYNGYIHNHDLYLIPILVIVGIVGTYIGKKLLDKISQDQFRTGVLFLILLIGIITLIITIFKH
ncbi:sulfite exporter TauE/SafE family protein [Leeuwenhoekiella sp. A16]|uniref:sulfite exporter TauE/SafE family protein n=1 Tax=unclassified Leeuwenhoekiella TaxID=2615029 RepID=UPI003A80B9A6